ncbi:uncharacterized protein A1O9_02006 [Exophiala aquamarina CBS 119918]|uniref:Uncharacterized protein n=1 Tax=Exophiala aquamarina CBS 119918 TaxID=1182545 RepID=A0A072PXX1_9EURO|nr:uncharacterized protein A1O9_02006 [Exophiala aquamarina CBS 119918]KEF60445.1 hypothetical protein A1O9_02006 [Exophiala aquamarina CBS 119918]
MASKRSRDDPGLDDEVASPQSKAENKRRRTALACAPLRWAETNLLVLSENGIRLRIPPAHDLNECNRRKRSYLSTLEDRLKIVESALENVQGQLHEMRHREDSGSGESSGSSCQNITNSILLQDSEKESEQVDAMGAVVFVNEEESGFFGMPPQVLPVFLLSNNRAIIQYRISTSNITGCKKQQ